MLPINRCLSNSINLRRNSEALNYEISHRRFKLAGLENSFYEHFTYMLNFRAGYFSRSDVCDKEQETPLRYTLRVHFTAELVV